jgi:hypothetical protein
MHGRRLTAATLNKLKVGDREKNELLGALAPMKKDSAPACSSDDS